MMTPIVSHDALGWFPDPDRGFDLGWRYIGFAVQHAVWYDWLGLVGIAAFVTRIAFREVESQALDVGAFVGFLLCLFVIAEWSVR